MSIGLFFVATSFPHKLNKLSDYPCFRDSGMLQNERTFSSAMELGTPPGGSTSQSYIGRTAKMNRASMEAERGIHSQIRILLSDPRLYGDRRQ